jgi:hypothetical protein
MASDNRTSLRFELGMTVAEVPLMLGSTVGGPAGWTFAGSASFTGEDGAPALRLSQLIARLKREHGGGDWFEREPVDVALTGLSAQYRSEPSAFTVRTDIAVTLREGATRDRDVTLDLAFLLARTAGDGEETASALLVALMTAGPIDLRTVAGADTGLIGRFLGDIRIDRLGVFHASEAITIDGALIDPRGGEPVAFAKGPSFSARLGDGRSFTEIALPPPSADDPGTPAKPPPTEAATRAPRADRPTEGASEHGPLRYWKKLDKTVGPLKFKRIGGEWNDGRLGLLLDASVSLAGLSVGLAGFAVRVEPAKLPKLKFADLEFGLDGMDLSFARGPVTISGALLRTTEDGRIAYTGQAMIRAASFSIGAIGSYTTTKEGDPSFFIFGAFAGVLGGPPCFVVQGVAAGFGYNRALTIPDIEDVREFPLVALALGPSESGEAGALDRLRASDHFPAVAGQYWIAAGIKFTAFKLVEGFALVTAQFGVRFEIALIGVATLRQPPAPAPRALVNVELALLARICPDDGFLSVQAQLTGNSFLFDARCRLTGGFAFCVWFKPTNPDAIDRAGDFVVTLGGYHPKFDVPAHYPNPPRIGFDWRMPECGVSITGGAYFALTPSFIMAGGRLNALFRSGDFSAWFEAHADFLIGWAPLHYEAQVGVRIGAALVLRLGGLSSVLSFELGATLTIWGPPFAGEAHVDLGIVAFTVPLGDRAAPRTAPPIHWPEFERTFLPPEWIGVSIAAGLVEDRTGDHGYAIVNPSALRLAVETFVPAVSIRVGEQAVAAPGDRPRLGIRPLGARDLKSDIAVTLSRGAMDCRPVLKNAPEALWSDAPTPDARGGAPLAAKVIKEALMGVEMLPPACRSFASVESRVGIGDDPHDLPARPVRRWTDARWIEPTERMTKFRQGWRSPRPETLAALEALGFGQAAAAPDLPEAFPDLWLAAPSLTPIGALPEPPHAG